MSGREGDGVLFPQLQVWRPNASQGQDFYYKPGKDIQVDAAGSRCDIVTKNCSQIFQCRLSTANHVSVEQGDILGVEIPPTLNSGFEPFFLSLTPGMQDHYIFRQQLSSSVHISDHVIWQRDDQLLISLEVDAGERVNTCTL